MPADQPPPNTISVIQTAIKDAAPRLAAALTGPDAPIAIAALGRVLVGDALASPEQIATAVHTADKATIQAAEQDVLSRLSKAGATLDLRSQILSSSTGIAVSALDDTEKARLVQIQTHDSTTRYLAIGVSAAFGIVLLALIIGGFLGRAVDAQLQPMLYTLLGVLATAWANIIGFYFGSSVGSLQKSQALQTSLLQQPPAGSRTATS